MKIQQPHTPVMLDEIQETFSYFSGGNFIDGTLGAAGHSIALANIFKLKNVNFTIIGVDKDTHALEIAKKKVAENNLSDRFIFVHDDFKNIKSILANLEIKEAHGALIDLGVSSMQLDTPERGFSFLAHDAPLDMRMNHDQKLDAATIVNNWKREEIEAILKEIGEERYAKPIALNIVKNRKSRPIVTVGDLMHMLEISIPAKERAIREKNYATNTFRALRIVVNGELQKLDKAVADFAEVLAPRAKLAMITFHSSEDRIVKNEFRRLENPCTCPPDLPTCVCGLKPIVKIITKKPIEPTEDEKRDNPRSRSAKLRVVEKL